MAEEIPNMSDTRPAVVVTGASSGIGWGTVKVLSAKGFRVFGSVRKPADADKLSSEFGAAFTPLLFDVTNETAVRAGAEKVRAELGGRRLAGLVNNAGVALGGPVTHMPVDVFRRQLEVNLVGVLICTQAFAPLLGMDKELQGPPGRIVNIGSVGGRHAFPFMAPYHTSKYGLEGLTESMRRELLMFGIDATLVAPGSVATKIWGKADEEDFSQYDDTPWKEPLAALRKQVAGIGAKGLSPERIGEAIWRQLTDARPPVYLRITPEPVTFQALTRLPKRMVDRMVAGRMGLIRK
jgi:NAD(P)-dependent dehydrogenase (short-subunit alcohol dehydrogenase family)